MSGELNISCLARSIGADGKNSIITANMLNEHHRSNSKHNKNGLAKLEELLKTKNDDLLPHLEINYIKI